MTPLTWSRQFDHRSRPWWRSRPATSCPAESSLAQFAREPLAVSSASYSHIVGGCPVCRARLQRLLLGPALS